MDKSILFNLFATKQRSDAGATFLPRKASAWSDFFKLEYNISKTNGGIRQ
ncbi:hypothetical protein [Planococcus sp. YIM B11945]